MLTIIEERCILCGAEIPQKGTVVKLHGEDYVLDYYNHGCNESTASFTKKSDLETLAEVRHRTELTFGPTQPA